MLVLYKKVPLRPAIAMIELIFAIVIIGITLLSAPMIISQSVQSINTNLKQEAIAAAASQISLILTYPWDEKSAYIKNPPFFNEFSLQPVHIREIIDARVLVFLGDSITTDHISPAGAIAETYPAGRYLIKKGVPPAAFNSYGSRRGNHEVMNSNFLKDFGFIVHPKEALLEIDDKLNGISLFAILFVA